MPKSFYHGDHGEKEKIPSVFLRVVCNYGMADARSRASQPLWSVLNRATSWSQQKKEDYHVGGDYQRNKERRKQAQRKFQEGIHGTWRGSCKVSRRSDHEANIE